jgi:outer membrane immunogenic protein
MKSLSIALAAFAALAVAAAAIPAQAQAQTRTSWTGPYIGINGGWTWGSLHPTASDIGPDSFFATANVPGVTQGASQHFYTSGGLAGGQLGFLYQTGQAILGAEAGFDWSGLQGSANNGPTKYTVTPGSTFAWNLQAKQDWLFTFLGRAGIDIGSWYPYVTAGLAVTHETYSAHFLDTFYPTNITNSFNKVAAGPALGVGAEMRFFDHWLLRGEFLYMQFQGFSGTGPIVCTPGVGNCSAPTPNKTTFAFKTSRFNEDIGRVALSYQF